MATKENIAYESDIKGFIRAPTSSTSGNVVVFEDGGTVADSGIKVSDIAKKSEISSTISSSVDASTDEIWNAVRGASADAAYVAKSWSAGTSYSEGDYCRAGDVGYVCVSAHTSGYQFDESKWKVALTADGRKAIDVMLASYSNDGMASLLDIAPSYDPKEEYSVGQMTVKDGKLSVCTEGGKGKSAVFKTGETVEKSVSSRVDALLGKIPTKTSDLENDSGFITGVSIPTKVSAFENDVGYALGSSLASAFDTTGKGYSVGDTCSRDGKLYICISEVTAGAAWRESDWRETDLDEIVSAKSIQAHPDWNETDETSPAYIKNKPNVRYRISNIVSDKSGDDSVVAFTLKDRTVNVIEATVDGNRTISLYPPSAASASESRDFYVVLNVSSDSATEVTVNVPRASLKDYAGASVSVTAPSGQIAVYRFTEILGGSTFLVSEYADPAYSAVREIERALDDILADGGAGSFATGIYLPGDDGKFYRLTAVTDENGEVNIDISQEGVER